MRNHTETQIYPTHVCHIKLCAIHRRQNNAMIKAYMRIYFQKVKLLVLKIL